VSPEAPARDYDALARACQRLDGQRPARAAGFVDAAWEVLHAADVSWLGFYLPDPDNAQQMVLGPRRDKPACSPIGTHGACGRSLREGVALVVRDVAALGEGYVACDPHDLAELVIPTTDEAGSRWGVLDLDSFSRGAFSADDARGLHACLLAAGLTHGPMPPLVEV